MTGHRPNSLPRALTLRSCVAVGLLVLGLACFSGAVQAQGQTNAVNGADKALAGAEKSKGKNKPVISDRPQVLGTTDVSKPSRPGADTSELTVRFQSARASYLESQKELKLKAAAEGTEEQRTLLREQSKESLAKWREEHRRVVEEQQERIKTMKTELQAELGQRLDSSGEGTGGGRGR
ncbi:MAG: hypothetical protein ACO1QS_04430 [Verrucomicrobiota bacterium]